MQPVLYHVFVEPFDIELENRNTPAITLTIVR